MTEKEWFARRKREQIQKLTERLNELLPGILGRYTFSKDAPYDFKSQQRSLNAKIGGKHATYLNVTDDVISSPEEFAARDYDLDVCGIPHEEDEVLPPDELIRRYREKRATLQHEIDEILLKIETMLNEHKPEA